MTDRCTATGNLPTNTDNNSVPNSNKLSDGQYKDHWVLCEDEILKKGFIRPVRTKYIHETCGGLTSMPQSIAETYATNPGYYGSTFCVRCGTYFPVGVNGQFIWEDGTKVGT